MTVADCGVAAHDATCLCDVKITAPCPINVNPLRDSWEAERVHRLLAADGVEVGYPVSGEGLLAFFTAQLEKYDEYRGMVDPKPPAGNKGSFQLTECGNEIFKMLRANIRPSVIRDSIEEKYGIRYRLNDISSKRGYLNRKIKEGKAGHLGVD